MHPELTQFEHWLSCQYPHSSVRKHYRSDLHSNKTDLRVF